MSSLLSQVGELQALELSFCYSINTNPIIIYNLVYRFLIHFINTDLHPYIQFYSIPNKFIDFLILPQTVAAEEQPSSGNINNGNFILAEKQQFQQSAVVQWGSKIRAAPIFYLWEWDSKKH